MCQLVETYKFECISTVEVAQGLSFIEGQTYTGVLTAPSQMVLQAGGDFGNVDVVFYGAPPENAFKAVN